MGDRARRLCTVTVLTLLYPLAAPLLAQVHNPMVPGGIVALHMIFPVMAGFFLGPLSGAVAGGAGTGLACLLWGGPFDLLAIIPHTVMGLLAGVLGRSRSEFVASLSIIPGHVLNMTFYLGYGALRIEPDLWGVTVLGLATESTVDMVAVILLCGMLKQRLYSEVRL